MGFWGIAYAAISVACLGMAVQTTFRIRTLNASASWIDQRLGSEASDYDATLQSRYIDQELQSFRERHRLLTESSAWWQLRLGILMFWVVASFAFYIYRVISNFSQEVTQGGSPPLPLGSPASSPVR
jgi:hypothetical protein